MRLFNSSFFVCFLAILVLSLQPAVYGTCVSVVTGAVIGVKDDCNKKQAKKKDKNKNKRKQRPDPSKTCDHTDVLIHGGVIAWADRPMGGGVVAWADRPMGGGVVAWASRPSHGDVVAWPQPRCISTNVIINSNSNYWLIAPNYPPPSNMDLQTGIVVAPQKQLSRSIKKPRRPSRPRSNAPHSGVVHWVTQSTQDHHVASVDDTRPRVWCVKHASRVCGCYLPSTQTSSIRVVRGGAATQ